MPTAQRLPSQAQTAGSEPSWAELHDALARGDSAAAHKLTAVIMSYLARLGAFELRDSWSDIAQEVVTTLLARIRSGALREPSALVSYALATTHSKWSDWLDGTRRRRQLHDTLSHDPSATAPATRSAELGLALLQALDTLDADARRVVEAVYLAGQTYEQAAAELGLSFRQVKRLQHRALAALRTALGVERKSQSLSTHGDKP